MIPHPLRGWTFPDYSGRMVHLKNGVRRSYEPSAGAGTDPIDVFFFGGSTMFGAYQRDEHTIPSQFARLAEANGRAVRVVNYGAIGYGIWQELQLLEELLTRGDVPDLVIFYDGANEQFIQARVGPIATPTHLHANIVQLGNLGAGERRSLLGDVYDWWADRSAAHRLFDQVKSLVTNEKDKPAVNPLQLALWAPDQSAARGVERGRDAVAIYQQALELVQHLAATYGFRAEFFWQPLLYTKPVVEGEQDALTVFGATPEAWYAETAEARRHLKPPVIDLSDVLDDVDEPLFVDFDHTNERGAALITSAIYKDTSSTLNELSTRRRP
jgi:lysophospholipase L1-like esterase